MSASGQKTSSKTWIWILAILAALLVCCCIAAVAGGYFYVDSQGTTVQGLLESQGEMLSTQVTLEPPIADVPQPETPPAETDKPLPAMGDHLVVVTDFGVWSVDEGTGETVQLSASPLDAPWDLNEGMAPDGQTFAYLTGFGGASRNPILVVLDMAQQTVALELPLTGPLTQPGNDSAPGDPAFEATRAMESAAALAWSPDGRMLAFSAAIDGDSADVYLYDRMDGSVIRLSDEMGNASDLHWSPDGSYIEYVSVNSFGTGAGYNMQGLWAIDMQTREAILLERLESSGEWFLGWTGPASFLVHSWGAACTAYNMRVVDVPGGEQRVLVEGCFSSAAFNPQQQVGMMSVADFNVENCLCGTPLDTAAMYAFYLDQPPVPVSKSEAYQINFNPEGGVFVFLPIDEKVAVYQHNDTPISILPEVAGLWPYPVSPNGYWAWASNSPTAVGLWVTGNNANPLEVSAHFRGKPAWSDDGQTIFYIEDNILYKASAPNFAPQTVPGVSGELKDVVN